MLVDNAVEGDSRVQKEARSAAARGWDVVLLGRSPDRKEHRWRVGDARVRLVPVPMTLNKRRHEFRWAPLRSPLAYPPGRMAAHATQKAKARRTEARTARALVRHKLVTGERTPLTALPEQAWAVGRQAYAKAYAELVDLRVARTEALKERRAAMDSPLDRFTTAFWEKALGTRAWRRLDPNLYDWELAFGPVVDDLRPDIIHANDFRMLGVGARAKFRAVAAGREVKLVWDAHEWLPGIHPWNSHPRWLKAQVAHEAEYAPYADAVVTVSEMMVDLLTEHHHLAATPQIVRNAPTVGLQPLPEGRSGVRELCQLDDDVPLLLYVGTAGPARGIDTMVEALPQLPGAHVALVARATAQLDRILQLAQDLGVRDRVHALPYVPVDLICGYIASADVGVCPSIHMPNHEVDLPTKYYEYAQARIPILVSDLKTTSETTRRLGIGEVFTAGDVDSFVRAARETLADRDRYLKAYDAAQPVLREWMWANQAEVLDSVYESLAPAD